MAYEREVVASEIYLVNTAAQDEMLQAVVKHQLWMTERNHHNNLQAANAVLKKYDFDGRFLVELLQNGWPPADRVNLSELAATQAFQLVDALSRKAIHGVYYEPFQTSEEVDHKGSFSWLSDGRLRAETEGLIFVAQDGVLLTNRYKHTVLKLGASSACRVCQEGDETIGHILSKCRTHCWCMTELFIA